MSEPETQRPVFTIKVEAKPGAPGIHALRALLKHLLRRLHLVCIAVFEEKESER